jgi:uncharacterized protein Yka (UPF0111/DUF47 family)
MSQFLDQDIFGGKKMGDLFEEIHDNSRKKSKQITALIKELRDLIEDPRDATVVVPLIVQFLEVGVKNDDHLIKIAGILQRAMQTHSASGEDIASFELSAKEMEQIQAEIKSFEDKG